MTKQKILKGALITGVINGIINGGIQYFLLENQEFVPISVDSISNSTETVLGTAVMLAITLAMILTMVAYFGIKEKRIAFFPSAFLLTIKHGFFAFGVLTGLAVLWQKYMGTVEVPFLTALIIIGIIAGLVSGVVNYLTIKGCTISEENPIKND